jgi:hypothetical protein
LLLQILVVAVVEFNSISCQYQQQNFPSPPNYDTQQQHVQPSPRPHEQQHHDYRQPSTDFHGSFDFEKFNQQAKQLQAQLQFFNQQQQKHIHDQINSVHRENSEPHFDFAVNQNYSDLEKASEQFVSLGNLIGKQNSPAKVIKITKTVAVKQPVPVPYPVPVVKVVKEQVPTNNFHNHPTPTEQPSHFPASSYYNFTSYTNPKPATKGPSNSYHQQQSSKPSLDEYDTKPFYVTTPQKETIKIIPVPYFVDEHGNKHEMTSSHDAPSSHYTSHDENVYPNQQTYDGSGKFQSFTISYHPPTQQQNTPETKYYYSHDSENSASSVNPSNYEDDSDEQHYRYKYVSYE